MVTIPIARNPEVTSVTVIEKEKDVLDSVGVEIVCYLSDEDPQARAKLQMIEADIFEWKPQPGIKWNMIYFDIWPSICGDNLPEMTRLHRKFGRRLKTDDPKRWMGSWAKGEIQARERRERRNRRGYRWP